MEIYSTHVFEILKYYDAVDINGNDYDEFVCFEYHCGWENTFDVFSPAALTAEEVESAGDVEIIIKHL
jgi:hypothetical protein